MPDQYGNLLGIEEFTTGLKVRFHSYLGSGDLVLCCPENSTCRLHDLRDGDAWQVSVFTLEARGGNRFGIWLGSYQQLELLGSNGHGGIRTEILRQDQHHARYFPTPDAPPEMNFRIDMLDSPWFALNDDTEQGVFDVKYGDARSGTDVILYPWNGGGNQRWRAQIETRF
jgi:hypothetical protein